jgi:hypothetical protein
MFYPGGLIRLIQTIRRWAKTLFQKIKHKWRMYRYGEDD